MTTAPILLVPFMWIGDYVRCHSVVRVLKERFPDREIDVLSSSLCAPLAPLMPGVRKAVIANFPRGKLSLGDRRTLAQQLKHEGYGSAYMMTGTLKDAIAPWLAGIPQRTGWLGEMRFGLLNDIRYGEDQFIHLADRCVALALPKNAPIPDTYPVPEFTVSEDTIAQYRRDQGLSSDRPLVALSPGCNDIGRTWPIERYAALAGELSEQGNDILVMGGPDEKHLADTIRPAVTDSEFHDFTGTSLPDAAIQSAVADLIVANDSGLLHLGAATGTPAIAIYGGSAHERTGPKNPAVYPVSPPGTFWAPGQPSRIREIQVDQICELAKEILAKR